jgi:hypothetical protein
MNHDAQVETKAKAFFHGTQVLRDFANTHVIPVLTQIISPTELDLALTGTYYRMHCWVLDVGKLDWPVHFQSVLGALRGTFESLVDLKLIVADPTLVAKFHAFPFVARFTAAKKYIEHLDADPSYVRPAKPEQRRLFITDPSHQKRYDDDRLKYWGADKNGKPITPEHWSGIDLASRTTRVGEAKRYRDIYSMCSWFVHSGSAGIAGISPDGVLTAFGYGHGRLQAVFSEGTEILCKTMHLFKATPGLEQAFEFARHASGAFLDPDQTDQSGD